MQRFHATDERQPGGCGLGPTLLFEVVTEVVLRLEASSGSPFRGRGRLSSLHLQDAIGEGAGRGQPDLRPAAAVTTVRVRDRDRCLPNRHPLSAT